MIFSYTNHPILEEKTTMNKNNEQKIFILGKYNKERKDERYDTVRGV